MERIRLDKMDKNDANTANEGDDDSERSFMVYGKSAFNRKKNMLLKITIAVTIGTFLSLFVK